MLHTSITSALVKPYFPLAFNFGEGEQICLLEEMSLEASTRNSNGNDQ
jgi:hypothetical protein